MYSFLLGNSINYKFFRTRHSEKYLEITAVKKCGKT
jgi:hypothetical protein